MTVRVRLAPSPTAPPVETKDGRAIYPGLHLGNVRTALFNYLFAKQHKDSVFLLRIENSDVERSSEGCADTIADDLNWLGLKPDEGYKIGGDYGPYTQLEKLERYKAVADEWIEKGYAYRCYCTPDELTALRNQLPEKERERFRYPGICRDRKDWPKNKDYVVRLKAPTEGSISWDDMVFGRITVPNVENFDWVIMRSSGIPLYSFGCSVDDYDHRISCVIRGRDHISNGPPQILMHQLLGTPEIKWTHLPMMLGPKRAKLSKRDAAVSVLDYRRAGYSPSAILNYLLKFGFGSGDQEIFSMGDMLEKFSLEACGKNDGCFDKDKFAAIQHEHLKQSRLTSDDDYTSLLEPHLVAKGFHDLPRDRVKSLVPVIRDRSKTLVDAANEMEPFLRQNITIDTASRDKFFTDENKANVRDFTTFLSNLDSWSVEALKERSTNWMTEHNISLKDIGQAVRVAVVGRTQSPELFATLAALGKDITLERLRCQTQQQ